MSLICTCGDIRSIRETKMELKKAKRKDFYKILGVTQSSTEHEIKKAYKKLALKYHPDRHASKTEEEKAAAEASFKDIGEAYSILSDPQKKQRYDSGVDLEDLDSDFGGGGMGGAMGGVDPSQIFQVRFCLMLTLVCYYCGVRLTPLCLQFADVLWRRRWRHGRYGRYGRHGRHGWHGRRPWSQPRRRPAIPLRLTSRKESRLVVGSVAVLEWIVARDRIVD